MRYFLFLIISLISITTFSQDTTKYLSKNELILQDRKNHQSTNSIYERLRELDYTILVKDIESGDAVPNAKVELKYVADSTLCDTVLITNDSGECILYLANETTWLNFKISHDDFETQSGSYSIDFWGIFTFALKDRKYHHVFSIYKGKVLDKNNYVKIEYAVDGGGLNSNSYYKTQFGVKLKDTISNYFIIDSILSEDSMRIIFDTDYYHGGVRSKFNNQRIIEFDTIFISTEKVSIRTKSICSGTTTSFKIIK